MTDVTPPEDISRYPTASLFAILPLGREDAAVRALRDAGWPERSVQVMGEGDAEAFRRGADSGTVRRRLYNLANTEDIEKGRRYTEQRDDEAVVRVVTGDADAARSAAAVLREHGGYHIHWFGRYASEAMG